MLSFFCLAAQFVMLSLSQHLWQEETIKLALANVSIAKINSILGECENDNDTQGKN